MGSRVWAWGLWLGVMLAMLAAPAAQARELKVLVMGDSLSAAYGLRADQGWVPLADAKSARYAFHNASLSGETSAGGRSRIAAELKRVKPDIVVIELGANDGLRGLPVAAAEANLRAMGEAVKKSGAQVVLVGMRMPPNYGPDYTRGFEQNYSVLAKQYGTALLPFLLEPIATDRTAFQADNLHPVASAQPKLRDHVWKSLSPLLK